MDTSGSYYELNRLIANGGRGALIVAFYMIASMSMVSCGGRRARISFALVSKCSKPHPITQERNVYADCFRFAVSNKHR